MGYLSVRYDSRVVIYERKMFIRLAAGSKLMNKVLSGGVTTILCSNTLLLVFNSITSL